MNARRQPKGVVANYDLSDISSCQNMVQGHFMWGPRTNRDSCATDTQNTWPRRHSPNGAPQAPSNKLCPAETDKDMTETAPCGQVVIVSKQPPGGDIYLCQPPGKVWHKIIFIVHSWSMLVIGSLSAMLLRLLACMSGDLAGHRFTRPEKPVQWESLLAIVGSSGGLKGCGRWRDSFISLPFYFGSQIRAEAHMTWGMSGA